MIAATVFVGLLALTIAGALGAAARRFPPDEESVVERVNGLLPQTQCGQCGYAGCRPYAASIVKDGIALNRCPPGGEATIYALSRLLNQPPAPPDPRFGVRKPPALAIIDEEACIGCALCLRACPVDAILGARRYMHTVIADECTGCELCIPPCPVDCIRMRLRTE